MKPAKKKTYRGDRRTLSCGTGPSAFPPALPYIEALVLVAFSVLARRAAKSEQSDCEQLEMRINMQSSVRAQDKQCARKFATRRACGALQTQTYAISVL